MIAVNDPYDGRWTVLDPSVWISGVLNDMSVAGLQQFRV